METRMAKLASGLALVLLSTGLGSCQLLGSEKASEANDSASKAPKIVPVETVNPSEAETETKAKPKSVKVVAATPLTRPTDPDVRVKAVKKGRSNPFAELVPPATTNAEPIGVTSARKQAKTNSSSAPARTRAASAPKPAQKKIVPASNSPKTNDLPRLGNPASDNNDIVLPPLPEPTLAKQVSVQGVIMLGGQPKAILKAPNENVTRTVQAGDTLANGQILVASIDMSDPQNPSVVLEESGQTVTVGVGSQPETIAAALPF